MAIGRPIAHHARDHRDSGPIRDSRVVSLDLRCLAFQGVIGHAALEGEHHGEQLRWMTDPFAVHPEITGVPCIVVDQAHPVQPALPVRGRIEMGLRDRKVEGHGVDGRNADGAGDRDDLGASPEGERMVALDRRQSQVGGIVGEAEDQACQAWSCPQGDLGKVGQRRS